VVSVEISERRLIMKLPETESVAGLWLLFFKRPVIVSV
jgi:hypothetical protein